MLYSRSWPGQGSYMTRVLSVISRMANVILLNGSQNESISARSYRIVYMQESCSKMWRFWAWAANKVYFWQDDHIKESYFYNVRYSEQFLDRHYRLMKLNEEHGNPETSGFPNYFQKNPKIGVWAKK